MKLKNQPKQKIMLPLLFCILALLVIHQVPDSNPFKNELMNNQDFTDGMVSGSSNLNDTFISTPYSQIPLSLPSINLRVQYRCLDPEVVLNQIKPQVDIYNDGLEDINLTDINFRYWFNSENILSDMLCDFDYAVVGSSNLRYLFNSTTVSDYIEVNFTADAGILASSSNTGEIQMRFYSSGYLLNDQSNDYSFDPSIISFANYTKVTVYYQGLLIWGDEPSNDGNFAPTVSSPADITYIEGDTATYIIGWTLSDSNPATYTITSPSGTSSPTTWNDNDYITETVNGLHQGTYTYTITATDIGGLSTADSVDVVVTPPLIAPTVSSPADITYIEGDTTTYTIGWTLSDSNPATYTITSPSGTSSPTTWNDNDYITETVNGLPQGTYTYTITATDIGGLSTADSVNVIVTPPPIAPTVSSPADITYSQGNTTTYIIGWTLSDSNPATYTITSPSGTSSPTTWNNNDYITESVSELAQGTHTYTIIATDTGGLSTADSVDVVVTPPLIAPTVSSPADITYIEGDTATYTIGWTLSDDNPATYTITSPSGTSSPTTWNDNDYITETVNGLAQGTYTYTITAIDTGGLSTFDSVNVIVTQPPIAPTVSTPADITYSKGDTATYTIGWTLSDDNPATYTITSPSGTSSPTTWNNNDYITESVSGLAQGTHTYIITATDTGGLSTSDSVDVVVTQPIIILPKPSTPTNLIITSSDPDNISLEWDNNPESDIDHYEVHRSTNPDFIPGINTQIAIVPSNLYTDNDISSELTYYYRIIAVNTNGIKSDPSLSATPSLNSIPDIFPPLPPADLFAPRADSSTIVLEWMDNAETDLSYYCIYRSTTPDFTPDSTNFIGNSYTSNFTDSGLNASTTYYYQITAVDIYGNEGKPSFQTMRTHSIKENNIPYLDIILVILSGISILIVLSSKKEKTKDTIYSTPSDIRNTFVLTKKRTKELYERGNTLKGIINDALKMESYQIGLEYITELAGIVEKIGDPDGIKYVKELWLTTENKYLYQERYLIEKQAISLRKRELFDKANELYERCRDISSQLFKNGIFNEDKKVKYYQNLTR